MKTLLVLLLLSFVPSVFATDNHIHDPVPVQVYQVADSDKHTANFLGAVVVSAIATDTLKDKEYAGIKVFAATVFSASIIEAAQSGGYNGSNVGYAALGAAVGTIGVCSLYLKKNFIGCGMPF